MDKLLVLVCNCHNSDHKARTIMEHAGMKDWASYPISKGKANCLHALDEIQHEDIKLLKAYISSRGSFVVFVLIKEDGRLFFKDASSGDMAEKLEAEALVKAFAEKRQM